MITHKKNGYLVNYDVDNIYHGMKEFLTNETLITKIRENLRDSEKQFDNQKIFNRVEEIITQLTTK